MSGGVLIYAAKRAVFGLLSDLIDEDTAQVSYAFPANPSQLLIYMGSTRFVREQALAEWGTVQETDVVDVWLRAAERGGDVESAEQSLEDLSTVVAHVFYSNQQIGGGLTFNDITAGEAPEAIVRGAPDPTIIARLRLQVSIRGWR